MSSNPCRVELGVCSTSVLSRTWTKHIFTAFFSGFTPFSLVSSSHLVLSTLSGSMMSFSSFIASYSDSIMFFSSSILPCSDSTMIILGSILFFPWFYCRVTCYVYVVTLRCVYVDVRWCTCFVIRINKILVQSGDPRPWIQQKCQFPTTKTHHTSMPRASNFQSSGRNHRLSGLCG